MRSYAPANNDDPQAAQCHALKEIDYISGLGTDEVRLLRGDLQHLESVRGLSPVGLRLVKALSVPADLFNDRHSKGKH